MHYSSFLENFPHPIYQHDLAPDLNYIKKNPPYVQLEKNMYTIARVIMYYFPYN